MRKPLGSAPRPTAHPSRRLHVHRPAGACGTGASRSYISTGKRLLHQGELFKPREFGLACGPLGHARLLLLLLWWWWLLLLKRRVQHGVAAFLVLAGRAGTHT